MKTKMKNMTQNNMGGLIAMAIGIGVANSVALDNSALGFGISLFIVGMIVLGQAVFKRA
jgi:hypothetical protein